MLTGDKWDNLTVPQRLDLLKSLSCSTFKAYLRWTELGDLLHYKLIEEFARRHNEQRFIPHTTLGR